VVRVVDAAQDAYHGESGSLRVAASLLGVVFFVALFPDIYYFCSGDSGDLGDVSSMSL
jgi:hypothetical protein